ncbi:MAG: OmpA family protein [Bacteroidetes bacterium]|nr:OmpA family protein [Bacteroidota bacterium]
MNKRMFPDLKVFFFFPSLLFLLAVSSITTYGQSGNQASSYNIMDSSVIPAKRMPQQNEFLNNAYPFPAKPRNAWELGIKGGYTTGITDVRNWGPTGGFGVHLRKAFGYMFSLRAEYDWLRLRGLNYQPTQAYGRNPVLSSYYGSGGVPNAPFVFNNYRSTVHELSLQGVFTINNINFHRAKTGWNMYFFGGPGLATYSTFMKTVNSSGTPYNYASIITKYNNNFTYKNRKDIRSDLKNLLTGDWSTMAERSNNNATLGGAPIMLVGVVGMGFQFKLNNKWNIAVEDKFTFTNSDLIDGQQWQNNYSPNAVQSIAQTRSADSYNFLSVGINYNLFTKHAVEPLWWINPLDYAYSEINAPRHMKLPKPVLDDADGDGVTDQFDMEPNTPKGSPVDSHGVSRDTDGDGVPDFKDKELVTPTQCQPVDADGVGKCPDPQCCKDLKNYIDNMGGNLGRKCNIGDLPSINFKGRSVSLNNDAKALLASAADKMRNNPGCKVAVIGYGESSKAAQQLSWDRVNAVINYLVEKEGIGADRLIFRYGQVGGEESTVDLKDGTGEEGPNTVPAPHPNLRRKK